MPTDDQCIVHAVELKSQIFHQSSVSLFIHIHNHLLVLVSVVYTHQYVLFTYMYVLSR